METKVKTLKHPGKKNRARAWTDGVHVPPVTSDPEADEVSQGQPQGGQAETEGKAAPGEQCAQQGV